MAAKILGMQQALGNQAVQQMAATCPAFPSACPTGGACHTCPVRVQAKLAISQPGDPYEQEADRVAEAVMRMPGPPLSRVREWEQGRQSEGKTATLQRKCAACASGQGLCPKCAEEERMQRKPLAAQITPLVQRQVTEELDAKKAPAGSRSIEGEEGVPPIVYEVLRSPGQPLDAATRAFFEPRFGYDFSGVRVHTDAKAAESARAVNARAYTVGRDVVFGAGQYAPGTYAGRSLIAHELSHTLQQSIGKMANDVELGIGESNTASKHQADVMAKAAMSGSRIHSIRAAIAGSINSLQRQGFGELRVAEALSEERAREEEVRKGSTGPMNMAGRILIDTDVENATRAAPGATSPTRITPGIRAGRFVLHDTAAAVGAARISALQQRGRRSSGEGAGAWVPRDTSAVIAHQPFFGPRRPAATQFERGEDIMKKAARESEYRAVWNATNRAQREATLNAVLLAQGSPPAEAKAERTNAIRELAATAGDVHSAGVWAVEDICRKVFNLGANAVARSRKLAPKLEGACQRLAPLFTTRAARIGSTVNVEIVQERGSDCRTTGTLTPLPPYTSNQYTNVMQLYLRAALEARFFPEITTHFLLDKGIGNHCDPRCFNLNRLYEEIRVAMGHGPGCVYGITPKYGTGSAHNVWWHNTVCGGPPPP
jgi:hypothetical protein